MFYRVKYMTHSLPVLTPQVLNFSFQHLCNDPPGNTLAVLGLFDQTSPLQTDTACVCVLCRYYSGSPLFPVGLLRGVRSSSASPTWIWMSKHLWKAKFTLAPLHTRFSGTYILTNPPQRHRGGYLLCK